MEKFTTNNIRNIENEVVRIYVKHCKERGSELEKDLTKLLATINDEELKLREFQNGLRELAFNLANKI